MEAAGTSPSDQRSILKATFKDGLRLPWRSRVTYGRETPSCPATARSVRFFATMNRANGVTRLVCPIGTSRVKEFVSAVNYAARTIGGTMAQ